MVDINKLICDFLSFEYKTDESSIFKYLSYKEKNIIRVAGCLIGMTLKSALKAQNLKFKDGELVPIEEERPWSLKDAKPGDVIYFIEKDHYNEWLVIFREIKDGWLKAYCSYCVTSKQFYDDKEICWGNAAHIQNARLASEEEKDHLLLYILKENGYSWNSADKELYKWWNKDIEAITNEPATISGVSCDTFIKVMADKFKNNLIESQDCHYIPVDGIVDTYQQGLEDMYNRLKRI